MILTIKQININRYKESKLDFLKKNIEIPFPHLTMFMGEDKRSNETLLNLNINDQNKDEPVKKSG